MTIASRFTVPGLNLVLVCVALGLIGAADVLAKSRVMTNQPYVTCLGGVFYARANPEAEKGTKGVTTIYGVHRVQDQVVERYDWYAPALHLGWSPIAGKVAAMAVYGERSNDPAEQVEFRFFLGAEHLATYTTADLFKMGAVAARNEVADPRGPADLRVVGCEQIPRTNEYVFRVILHTRTGDKTIDFDVLTGKPYDAAQAATRPAHD